MAPIVGREAICRAAIVACVAFAASAPAAEPAAEPLVERLIGLVRENYVLEERVEAIAERLRSALAAGRYDAAPDPGALAAVLTEDLRAASGDLHFGVRPRPGGAAGGAGSGSAAGAPARTGSLGIDPGLGRVAVLDGNVGLLAIRAFADPAVGGAAADAAFETLAGTDALILDLRASRGGSPEMVAYLMSYLFAGEPFVFNRFHWRNSGRTVELSTRADLPAPRYAGRAVFVLVSRRTPSAAEGLAYHLRQYGRATLVGERTAGAAHTYQVFPLGGLEVAIPTGRPVSPVSGANWEGVGVPPDHEAPAGAALAVAHRLALEGLLAAAGDGAARARLEAALAELPER